VRAIALTIVMGTAYQALAEPVALPGASTSTMFCVNVVEQADVVVPTSVSLTTTSPAAEVVSGPQRLTIRSMVLAEGRRLRVSVRPETSSFLAPAAGRTWQAGDLSYVVGSGPTWSGASGRMRPANWAEVLTTAPNPGLPVLASVVFRLPGIAGAVPPGRHSLVLVWKIESL
jgi:hypothetical protein